jgi:hypothetical protein
MKEPPPPVCGVRVRGFCGVCWCPVCVSSPSRAVLCARRILGLLRHSSLCKLMCSREKLLGLGSMVSTCFHLVWTSVSLLVGVVSATVAVVTFAVFGDGHVRR